jgi:PAS domain S-box-containing protein
MDLTQSELLLRQAETAAAALLNALTDEICVVDGSGQLVAVNEAWERAAGSSHGYLAGTGVGQNCLDVCRIAAAAGTSDAGDAVLGLTSVLRKSTDEFSMEYEWTEGDRRRWFRLTATALANQSGAVISHREITERRKAQEALRLSGELHQVGPLFESFLPALVRNLASALDVRHAFLSECVEHSPGRLQLLTHWAGDGYGDLFSYDTVGTPCERVLTGQSATFPSGLQRLFPEDKWLTEVEAESYIGVPLRDPSGKVLGHLAVIDTKPLADPAFAETTLRVFAARATPELVRRKIEHRLADQARLLDYAADAIIGTDGDLVITYWNKAAEAIYGWPAEEVLGRNTQEILKTHITPERRAEAQRLARESTPHHGEFIQHRRDGSEIEVDSTIVAFSDPEGRISGYVGINRDITERKRVEAALRQAERNTQAILEAIPDMMFRLDRDGRFLDFKPARDLAPLVPPSAFLGKLVTDVLPQDLAQANLEMIRVCLRTGETQTLVYQLIEDGVPRDYESRVIPLADNEVLAVVRAYTSRPGRDVGAPRLSEDTSGDAFQRWSQLPGQHDKANVLIAAEDFSLTRLLRRTLLQSGHKTITAGTAIEAVSLAGTAAPDLILLDGTLPGTTAAGILREIRDVSLAPIIVLLPAEGEDDAPNALRSGADDFIRKPVSAAELNARAETVLRRRFRPVDQVSMRLELGDLVIEPAARSVTVAQTPIVLTPTEYKLLYELAIAAGRVLTHDEILDRVWGNGYAGDYELLRTYVRNLRRKLGDEPGRPRFLRSEHGVGYRLMRP